MNREKYEELRGKMENLDLQEREASKALKHLDGCREQAHDEEEKEAYFQAWQIIDNYRWTVVEKIDELSPELSEAYDAMVKEVAAELKYQEDEYRRMTK